MFQVFELTSLAGVRASWSLNWLSDVAGSERPLGCLVPDSVGCATPLGARETLASVQGCGASDSWSVDW